MEPTSSKNTLLWIVIIILLALVAYLMLGRMNSPQPMQNSITTEPAKTSNTTSTSPAQATSTYQKHGFTMELPQGYVPKEEQAEGGPSIAITLPHGTLNYVTDAAFWEKYNISQYTYVKDENIGETTFKVYTYNGVTLYWLKEGNIGYEYSGDVNQLLTFKFTGFTQ